ncbi:MAG: polyprenol monophosphomannose synthase [Actinomycetota bacterium]
MATDRASDRKQALVITPTYNERDSIGQAVSRLFDAAADRVDLLVIDDGSPDGTGELVQQLAAGPHDIHLMERGAKLGLGTAYIAGFRWAMERGYRAVVEMDADLSHDPGSVPRLLDALEGADLAIGSRYVPGGAVENWSKSRQLLSKAGNAYARMWLGFPVHDATAGFRAYRTEFLKELDLDSVTSEGYGFQIEMTRRAYKHGGRIVEVPITLGERVAGHSKMSKQIVVEALASVTKWGVRDRFGRSR